MSLGAYYNEFDPYAAEWLRNLIAKGLIAPGDVDTRSIIDVQPEDLIGYRQCHFFAGIGGWSLAARLAGWPDDREIWTGSPPCQPFSVAGKGKAQADDRHLWPHLFRLVSARRPAVLMGEQVAAAVGKDWLDGVAADLEGIGYACGAAVVPACAVDAPHRRDRLWFVAHAVGEGRGQARLSSAGDISPDGNWSGNRTCDASASGNSACVVADADGIGGQVDSHARGSADGSGAGQVAGFGGACDGALADADKSRACAQRQQRGGEFGGSGGDQGACVGVLADASQLFGNGREHHTRGSSKGAHAPPQSGISHWGAASRLECWDGKARRVEPGIRLLAHGVPGRVGKLRAYGNAIVPQVAAEVIGAYLDCCP